MSLSLGKDDYDMSLSLGKDDYDMSLSLGKDDYDMSLSFFVFCKLRIKYLHCETFY